MKTTNSRVAYAYNLAGPFSGAFINGAPTWLNHMLNSEYRVAWHVWAGIPNPLFSPFVGKHISSRSTRGGGRTAVRSAHTATTSAPSRADT